MRPDEIEQVIKANIDKTVCVVYADGKTEMLFVHTVDDEGFVCDIVAEMAQSPACAYWVSRCPRGSPSGKQARREVKSI